MKKTKQIKVGNLTIGGGNPVIVQSMCNTDTRDVNATVQQIKELENVGCELVRVAVVDNDAARAIYDIKKQINIPIVADIHFDYRLAIEAVSAGADKIRLNPGNIGGEDRVKKVVDACRSRNIPIRIGVNGGSLDKELLAKYGVTPYAMVMSAMSHVEILNRFDFDDIAISIKASDVNKTIDAYRLLSEKTDYPLHLGVTETGTAFMGSIKSAVGIGSLLCDGIGDTMRVSLTADPTEEIRVAYAILKACGRRERGVNLVSCPTCGRCRINLIDIASEVEKRLQTETRPLTVAVMGCAVNGPGEAREADFGIAGGDGEGLLFKKGEIIKKVPMGSLVDELIELIDELPQ